MTFEQVAVKLAADLRKAIPLWSHEDIAACIGNGAHESGGFQKLQEIKPVVAGSKGGYGYFQWTGPRRRAFEAWASKRNLPINSYEANSGFLIYELQTSEKGAVGNVRRARGLEAKVKAFEASYERAGVKHYDSRYKWALKASALIGQDVADEPEAVKAIAPKGPKPLTKSTTIWAQIGGIVSTSGAGILAALNGIDWKTAAVVGAVFVLCVALWTISERFRHARENGV